MKRFAGLFVVAVLAGAMTLGVYKLYLEPTTPTITDATVENTVKPTLIPTNYSTTNNTITAEAGVDFTIAAEKTLNAVVHVKQYGYTRTPRSLQELFSNGGRREKQIQGAGSGVIIMENGYIVTNNHVIDGASALEVTLNNNKSYKAEVVGTSPESDIALLKIEPDEKLTYIPFGDSDTAKVGEWVLAVGNPFNLTSTVTAGIISAKARDLNEYDSNIQSFIQTDAAINPGNSGGALVNTKGELIGINTAISSQTGSYVGYAFAVPSNNAKKIVEDIMEYGDVQRGIIGITGSSINPDLLQRKEYIEMVKEFGITESQGVLVAGVEEESGADKAGITKGDVIKEIDGIKIRKFSDLTGYVNSKRPNDVLNIKVKRNGKFLRVPVRLTKYNTFKIIDVGIEVANASKSDLKRHDLEHGVKIKSVLNKKMQGYNLEGIIITKIDNQIVKNVEDVKRIVRSKDKNEDISVSLIDHNGQRREFIFQ